MGFDNTVTIVGNVTRDPELRFSQGGMAIANFAVAWDRKKPNGEKEASFFDVTCFRDLAENVAESITKGVRVVIYGTLKQDSWDNPEGERQYKVKILADEVSPSLRWASAEIRRNEYKGDSGAAPRGATGGSGGGGGRAVSPQAAPPAYDMDEEPF